METSERSREGACSGKCKVRVRERVPWSRMDPRSADRARLRAVGGFWSRAESAGGEP
jgi:hypothetical protein